MRLSTYLVGFAVSVLVGCVDAPPSNAPDTDSVESSVSQSQSQSQDFTPTGGGATTLVYHTPGSACSPNGSFSLCCPGGGCSCPGTQDCENGAWSACYGYGKLPNPCP